MKTVRDLIEDAKSQRSPAAKTAKQLLHEAMSVRITVEEPSLQAMQMVVDALAERARPEIDRLSPDGVLAFAAKGCERYGRLVRVTSSLAAPKGLEDAVPGARRSLQAYCHATLAAFRELGLYEPDGSAQPAKALLAAAMSIMPPVESFDQVDQALAEVTKKIVEKTVAIIPTLSAIQVLCSAADGCSRMGAAAQLTAGDASKRFGEAARESLPLYCEAYLAALRELESNPTGAPRP